ncbi:helicase associated domain-containing protein [Kitasatospora sp. NPDC093102]|uniref:helicase associated domain-containing protein n=1 Tax=Kitasatospora sp. NPDC093102 TaxID=3155069 RepID=UPI003421F826
MREVVVAQRRHGRLLRNRPHAERAFVIARAAVTSWWAQQWPREETWPRRGEALTPVGADPGWWRIATRDAVVYPEAVAVASVLTDPYVQRRVLQDVGGHLPHVLADASYLVAELVRVLGRPWLGEEIASEAAGPLFAWLRGCVKSRGDTDGCGLMWKSHSAHQPLPLGQALKAYQDAATDADAHEVSGLVPGQGPVDRAFAAGMEQARSYAARHGHLAVPKAGRTPDGHPLGTFLSNQRNRTTMPLAHAQQLEALDPWWNAPWPVSWQRTYYRARDIARTRGLRPEAGFPNTPISLGEWLHAQCRQFDRLHPQQQRLLADIGITRDGARAARPRRRKLQANFETGLEHARAYAAEHGHLCVPAGGRQGDFPLGIWLAGHRQRNRRTTEPSPNAHALSTIDPWWNPPWGIPWQRRYHEVRTQASAAGLVLDARAGFPGTTDQSAMWLYTQCAAYRELHPQQRELLTAIGITADDAAAAQQRYDGTTTDFPTGLPYARSYAAEHGHLALLYGHTHHGFPLGRWLSQHRAAATAQMRLTGRPARSTAVLSELDPWWNPPWSITWQHHWQQARIRLAVGQLRADDDFTEIDEPLRTWLEQQCADYDSLLPEQRKLLADIGIAEEQARTWTKAPTTRPHHPVTDTALSHARAYTAAHGHLALHRDEPHDGFPLGAWLNDQRARAGRRTYITPLHQELADLDWRWNPPWPFRWQRTYQQARTAHAQGRPLPRLVEAWALDQQRAWTGLHPQQQQLLAAIGVTPAHPGPRPVRAVKLSPGLEHARAYAAEHGHLVPSKTTEHNGFPLGRWLGQQRVHARQGRLSEAIRKPVTGLGIRTSVLGFPNRVISVLSPHEDRAPVQFGGCRDRKTARRPCCRFCTPSPWSAATRYPQGVTVSRTGTATRATMASVFDATTAT